MSLRVCPDCGGILEATRPEWLEMIALSMGQAVEQRAPRWQCLICGYHEDDDGQPITATGGRVAHS